MGRTAGTNIRIVAKAAGVSPATASRALNGNTSVNAELTQRVLEAANKLGYPIHNELRKKNIVFIMPGVSNTYYSKTLTGVFDVIQPLGYRVQIMLSYSDPEKECLCLQEACNPDTAGIILAPVTNTDPRLSVPKLADIPMVITGPRNLADGLVHVHLDNIEAAYQTTRYLLRLGRKSIAFVIYFWAHNIQNYEEFLKEYHTARPGCFTAFDRYSGYCRALEEVGISDPNPDLLAFGGMSYESGFDCAQQLLCSGANFDAVIMPNDRCGAGMLNALQVQGFQVPHQISLVCLDSDLIGQVVSPTLTSLVSADYKLGEHCAHQLVNLIRGDPAQNVVVIPKLLIESSTKVVE